MSLYTAATDSTITVWWEQPAQSKPKALYSVLVDGKCVQQVHKTHCTVEKLNAQTLYQVQILVPQELLKHSSNTLILVATGSLANHYSNRHRQTCGIPAGIAFGFDTK